MAQFDGTRAAEYGFSINENGGIYEQGKTYDIFKKIQVRMNI